MKKLTRTFVFNLSLTLVYCIGIYIQSSYPSVHRLPDMRHMDKVLHFGGYALLGIFFFRTFQALPIDISIKLAMAIGMASSALYGISDEIHQHFVPYRHADVWDAVADGLGAVFGVLVYRYGWVRGKQG